jgi:PHD/YefM family antitoxin component YafN of YafNO toxin-antitoxin module
MASAVQYVVDEKGERQAVVLSIDEYERMKEDLADLAVAAERRGEVSISHDQFMEELKRDGLLSN